MTEEQRRAKHQFIEKVRRLNADQLKELFESLKKENAPLGMMGFVANEYELRLRGMRSRKILK